VIGVSWCSDKKKYKVTVIKNGKYIHGGFFETLDEAEKRSHTMRSELLPFYNPDVYQKRLEEENSGKNN